MTWTPRNIGIASGIGIVLIVALGMVIVEGGTSDMTITSSAFTNGGAIPVKYSCKGEGINPPITISNIPKNTKSVVLYVYDQDVPKGGFVHWLVYNMDPKTTDIPEGKVPTGSVEGLNTAKNTSYVPVCPPSGTHHYLFTAYAVSTNFHFVKTPDIDHLKKAMMWQVLGKASMTATFTHQ